MGVAGYQLKRRSCHDLRRAMAVDSRNVALNIKQLMRFYGSLVANNNGTLRQTDGLRGGWATMAATCTLSHKIKDNHYFSKIAHKSLACSLYRSPRKCIKIRYVCAREGRRESEREYLSVCRKCASQREQQEQE